MTYAELPSEKKKHFVRCVALLSALKAAGGEMTTKALAAGYEIEAGEGKGAETVINVSGSCLRLGWIEQTADAVKLTKRGTDIATRVG